MISIDTTILYRVATHFIEKSFDYALLDTANDITELIRTSNGPINEFKLSMEAHKVILTDNLDQVFYSVYDENRNYLAGETVLPFIMIKKPLNGGKIYSKISINHNLARAVTLEAIISGGNNDKKIYVQVAETLNKRNKLSQQILLGIILPQIILLFSAAIMFHFGIKRGLSPLKALNDALMKRSYRELSPIQLNKVPNEVNGLIKSINSLMSQIKSVLESQNQFVADAAHQLKTPLAGIQAHLELIELEQDEKQHQSSLIKINECVAKLSHMVSQLLKLAQNQPETSNYLEMDIVDLDKLSKHICTEMVPTAYVKNIDLGFEVSKEKEADFKILGDSKKLGVMLENIIDNAIRYTTYGGKVTVCTKASSKKVILSVEDNGIGIPKGEQERVFERFHRVIDNRQEGSGLGLSIVKEIIQLHDAEITIESGKSGVGTKVIITFPVAEYC